MLQDDIVTSLCQLGVTIVEGIVTSETKRIALCHLDMAKSFETIGLLIEMGTVAVEVSTSMAEMNVTMQHLSVIITKLVVVQIVRMYQVYTFILHLFITWSTLTLWLRSKGNSQHQYTQNNSQRLSQF